MDFVRSLKDWKPRTRNLVTMLDRKTLVPFRSQLTKELVFLIIRILNTVNCIQYSEFELAEREGLLLASRSQPELKAQATRRFGSCLAVEPAYEFEITFFNTSIFESLENKFGLVTQFAFANKCQTYV